VIHVIHHPEGMVGGVHPSALLLVRAVDAPVIFF
jgi:hypothetical protein